MMRSALLFILLFLSVSAANAAELTPYRDKLFAYPKTIERSKDGSFLRVAYDKQRDIFERDQIPRRKAKQAYVNENVRWSRRLRSYKSANGKFKMNAVGAYRGGAKLTVIYVHGKGGNHRQGVRDWTFGGNFNRLQNLMAKNNGLLLTPTFSDFGERGAQDIAAVMQYARKLSRNTRLYIACGSMGGSVCWQLVSAKNTAAQLDGAILLGSATYGAFLKSPTIRSNRPVPIFIGHGSKDQVFAARAQINFFKKIRKKNANYPIRFVMFETGVHGTPVRMVDWRRELNWMLSLSR